MAFALRYVRPQRPQQSGKAEPGHRIAHEEFWSRHHFVDFDAAASGLHAWKTTYTHDRFSLALRGLTQAEKLASRLVRPQ